MDKWGLPDIYKIIYLLITLLNGTNVKITEYFLMPSAIFVLILIDKRPT